MVCSSVVYLSIDTDNSSALTNITSSEAIHSYTAVADAWKLRINEIQGAILLASMIQVS